MKSRVHSAGYIWFVIVALCILCEPLYSVCNVPQPRLVRAEYSQSEAVVIAHLVNSRHVEPKDDLDYHLYTFEVDTTLRGKIPKRFVLFDENSSGRLAFDIRRGHKYLLFIDKWQEKGWWTADGCGNSGDVAKRSKTLREIERVRALQSALITGEIDFSTAKSNATVVATRKEDGKKFEGAVRNYRFRLEVPPGEYSVEVSAAGMSFAMDSFSYEDAGAVRLEEGGCAQIAFVRSNSAAAVHHKK